MTGQGAPILIGEKTVQQIRDAELLREQARAMYVQAETRLQAIVTTLREARDLPESWQVALMADGKYYIAPPAEKAPAGETAPAAPA